MTARDQAYQRGHGYIRLAVAVIQAWLTSFPSACTVNFEHLDLIVETNTVMHIVRPSKYSGKKPKPLDAPLAHHFGYHGHFCVHLFVIRSSLLAQQLFLSSVTPNGCSMLTRSAGTTQSSMSTQWSSWSFCSNSLSKWDQMKFQSRFITVIINERQVFESL